MHQRLVGAAQAGRDADGGQSRLGTAARRTAFEQPAFDTGARDGRPLNSFTQASSVRGMRTSSRTAMDDR